MRNKIKILFLVLVIFLLCATNNLKKEVKAATAMSTIDYFDEIHNLDFLSFEYKNANVHQNFEVVIENNKTTIYARNLSQEYYYVLTAPMYDTNVKPLAGLSNTFILHEGNIVTHKNHFGLNYFPNPDDCGTGNFIYEYMGFDDGFSMESFKSNGQNVIFIDETNKYSQDQLYLFKMFTFSKKRDLQEFHKINDQIDPSKKYVYLMNYDYKKPFWLIKGSLAAIDNVDNDVTEKITFETDYPVDDSYKEADIGDYNVTARVIDSSDNLSEFKFVIRVKDFAPPVIVGESSLTFKTHSLKNIESIKEQMLVSDNRDKGSQLSLVIKTDTFTGNEDKVGNYSVVFECKDESGNVATKSVTVRVTDGLAPTLIGPEEIKSRNVLTNSEILSKYTAHDDIDNDITSKIRIVSNTCPGLVMGSYMVILEVSDTASNITTKEVSYILFDDEGAVFWTDINIRVDTMTLLQPLDVVNMMTEMGLISKEDEVTLVSAYFDNYSVVGEYLVTAYCKNQLGEEREERAYINVEERILGNDTSNKPPKEITKNSSNEEKIKNLVVWISSSMSALLALTYIIYKKRK